ncbi:hypothetical protein [uncultured Desulfobacter sp.]|uniref:hypothetical protein n=1 Tax=uncultured Desulfobacter sp. TaxID=240139 RepID=UPI002AAC2395|nr:hypothetical protein [uncultured Desulfobacter sp.]
MIDLYFFPFTFMDARQAKTLFCFFDQLNILDIHNGAVLAGPMAELEAKGAIERVPLDGEKLNEAEQKVRAYLDWAAIHKGNEKNLRALIRENIFFKDDSGVAAIRAGIRKGAVAQEPCATNGRDSNDPLVFLKLADIHDREHQAIQSALDALDQENASLFAELKGEEDIPVSVTHAQTSDPGLAMTKKRIRAWFETASDSEILDQRGIPVLVTTSRAVMDEFMTGAGEPINTLDIDSIKVHSNDGEFITQRHFKAKAILELMAKGEQTATGLIPDAENNYSKDAAKNAVAGRIQIRFFPGRGYVNLNEKNPGGQIGVCLVELNS